MALAEARARHAGEVKGMERAFGGIQQVYGQNGGRDGIRDGHIQPGSTSSQEQGGVKGTVQSQGRLKGRGKGKGKSISMS